MGVITKFVSVTAFVFSSLFFSLSVFASSSKQVFTVCYENQNLLPYVKPIPSRQRDKAPQLGTLGAIADLVLLAAEPLNLQVRFVSLPWKRCIKEIEQNTVDALFAAIWLPERDRWGRFPKSGGELDRSLYLVDIKYRVFVNKSGVLSWDGKQFSGVKNGVSTTLGYVIHKQLAEMGVLPKKSMLLDESMDLKQGLHLVSSNLLDGYIIDEVIGNHMIAENDLSDKVKMLAVPFMQTEMYMPVSHRWYQQDPERARKFWATLKQVRDDQGPKIIRHYQ